MIMGGSKGRWWLSTYFVCSPLPGGPYQLEHLKPCKPEATLARWRHGRLMVLLGYSLIFHFSFQFEEHDPTLKSFK